MKSKKFWKFFFLFPVIIYVAFLIALPLLYILLISFFKSDYYGGMLTTFTVQNYIDAFDQVYVSVFLKSIFIALITTIICILIAIIKSFLITKTKNNQTKEENNTSEN